MAYFYCHQGGFFLIDFESYRFKMKQYVKR